jgi:hypothetical protein
LTSHKVNHAQKTVSKVCVTILEKVSLLSPLFGSSLARVLDLQFSSIALAFSIIGGIMLYIAVNEYLSDEKTISVKSLLFGQIFFIPILLLSHV